MNDIIGSILEKYSIYLTLLYNFQGNNFKKKNYVLIMLVNMVSSTNLCLSELQWHNCIDNVDHKIDLDIQDDSDLNQVPLDTLQFLQCKPILAPWIFNHVFVGVEQHALKNWFWNLI